MTKIFIYYSSFFYESGAERALLNLLHALSKKKYSIDLALNDGRGHMFRLIPERVNVLPLLKQLGKCTPELLQELRDEGRGDIADIREFVYKRARQPDFLALSPEEQKLRSWEDLIKIVPNYGDYDVAIAFGGGGIALKIVLEKLTAKKRLMFIHNDMKLTTYHQERYRWFSKCNYPFWERFDYIAVLTEQNKDSFIELFPDLRSKIIVLPNINYAEYIDQESGEYYPAEYGLDTFNLFSAARISVQKGVDLMFEASHILRDKGLNFRWVVAGVSADDFGSRFLTMYKKSGIKDKLVIKDNMPNPFPYYKNCDLYVQPSRYEGRCIALEEAKILNCAILATKYPSVTDVITDGVNGVLCDINAQSIADNIMALYNDKALRERLMQANDSYTGDTGIEQYIELLG